LLEDDLLIQLMNPVLSAMAHSLDSPMARFRGGLRRVGDRDSRFIVAWALMTSSYEDS